jgi:hypothetical protein
MINGGLTDNTKNVLRTTVQAIRERLIHDMTLAAERKFGLSVKNRARLTFSREITHQYALLETWSNDRIRRFRSMDDNIRDAIREAAYTLTNRLFILMQLEARSILKVPVVTGGKKSPGYRAFRDFCPGLCDTDDGGYGFLLNQVFRYVSRDLPGFFTDSPITALFDVPGPVLAWLVEQLNRSDLAPVWTDDTTLGWLYQYWNDPDRKKVNDKVDGRGVKKGKVEAHEIAHATQLFTERYMVEWLLQNSLGTQWLAICRKNGWKTTALDIIQELEDRRTAWRAKIERKEEPEDRPMPIKPKEVYWKFYVDQPIPDDVVKAAPESIQGVKILDPACGSGHFLVYAFDMLLDFYREETTFTGTEWSDADIVQSIIGHNLHGIDIDPRAVQLAAAGLYIKTKSVAPNAHPEQMNLVASNLGLGDLPADDPALRSFLETLELEAGIPPDKSRELIDMLKGADYMGSLLQIDTALDKMVGSTRSIGSTQMKAVGNDEERRAMVIRVIDDALRQFLAAHDRGDDLGVRSRAEQLEKGVRLIEIISRRYEVVCANPPYLSKSKCSETIQNLFSDGVAELYELFVYKFIKMSSEFGFMAFLAAQNFMFISKFEKLREKIQKETHVFRCLHFGSDTFKDVLNALGFVGAILLKSNRINSSGCYIRLERIPMDLKEVAALCPPLNRCFTFKQSKFKDIDGWPMIYWWPEEFRNSYLDAPKISDHCHVKNGINTHANTRFVRLWFEIEALNKEFSWYAKGSLDSKWYFPIIYKIYWGQKRHTEKFIMAKGWTLSYAIYSREYFSEPGASYSIIGANPVAGIRKASIFDMSASSIFTNKDIYSVITNINTIPGMFIATSLNPTINFQKADLDRMPIFNISSNQKILVNKLVELHKENISNIEKYYEYSYNKKFFNMELFELHVLETKNELDRLSLEKFTDESRMAILNEQGNLTSSYSKIDSNLVSEDRLIKFADIYLYGPYESEFGEIKRKADGTPIRGKLQNLEELCHEFKLHPESIIALRKKLGLHRKSDRQDEAYRHLAWALGVALGRFDAQTGGLVDLADQRRQEQHLEPDPGASKALPGGMFFLTERGRDETDTADSARNQGLINYLKHILDYKHGSAEADSIWAEINAALVLDCIDNPTYRQKAKTDLNVFLREKCFDFHKSVYENRPIYFPLSSAKKSFVVWCNIHTWNDGTLQKVLADFLMPELRVLELRLDEIRRNRVEATNAGDKGRLEKEIDRLTRWTEELTEFADAVALIAEKGPNPDVQEREMPFQMDLDDGVMVNSSALWPLLHPQWKDPKKWWEHMEKPAGKNDYDWSHLAMRYWPKRVWKKLEKDPSLAVAHADYGEFTGRDLFRELYADMARKWDDEQTKRRQKPLFEPDSPDE